MASAFARCMTFSSNRLRSRAELHPLCPSVEFFGTRLENGISTATSQSGAHARSIPASARLLPFEQCPLVDGMRGSVLRRKGTLSTPV